MDFNADGVASQSPGLAVLFAANPGWDEGVPSTLQLSPDATLTELRGTASGYTLAYVRMAYSYWKSTYFGFLDPEETIPKIKGAALEAVKLDDTMAEAHAVLGLALGTGDFLLILSRASYNG